MELNLIEKFADPELIAEMSLVDKLKATLVEFSLRTGLCFAVVVLIALMLIVILVRRIVGRYELKQEYRRQVHRARKLRSAKLDKRKSEAEQHGFETIRGEVRSASVGPAVYGGEGQKVRIKIGKRRQEQVRIILMKQLSQQLLRRFLPWRERLRSGSGSEALCTDLMKKRYGSHMRVWKPAAGKDGKDR